MEGFDSEALKEAGEAAQAAVDDDLRNEIQTRLGDLLRILLIRK